MTAYTVQTPPHTGLNLAMGAPGGTTGDTCPTGNSVALLVLNGNSSSMTLTLPVAQTVDGLAVASRVVTVPATTHALIPLPASVYGSEPIAVTYSAITSLTVACILVPVG